MLYAIVAVLILVLDQGMKYWTSLNIALDTGSIELIPGVLHLANIHNTGAAFGILENARWIFVALALVFTVAIIVLLAKNVIRGRFGRWMAILVLAGALGNCIDRAFWGFVVDMFELEFIHFPVFNVADIFITIGGILFCIHFIFYKEPEVSEEEQEAEAQKQERLARQREAADHRSVADISAISKEKGEKSRGFRTEPIKTSEVRARAKAEAEAKMELGNDYDPFAEWNKDVGSGTVKTTEVRDPHEIPIFVPPAEAAQEERPARAVASAPETVEKTEKKARHHHAVHAHADRMEKAPEHRPAQTPAAQPEPVKDKDFSLEDILQEFKDL